MTTLPFVPLPDERFGQLIRRRRWELEITRLELAAAVGVDKGTLRKWEREYSLPHISWETKRPRLAPLSTALSAPPYEIYNALKRSYETKHDLTNIRIGAQCGTSSGYSAHLQHDEKPCKACQKEHNSCEEQKRRAKGVQPRETAPCGTTAGYWTHFRRKELVCKPCREAINAQGAIYNQERRRKKAQDEGRTLKPHRAKALCGTTSGCKAHYDRGEKPCTACREAVNKDRRERQVKQTGKPVGTARTTEPAVCGTTRGYRAHLRRGEKTCEACRNAIYDYQNQIRLRKGEKPRSTPVPIVCGTNSGYNKHLYWKEETCKACRSAHADVVKARKLKNPPPSRAKPESELIRKPTVCGTNGGYNKHLRLKETTCKACREAHAKAVMERKLRARARKS